MVPRVGVLKDFNNRGLIKKMWVNVEEGTIYGDFYKASKEVPK